MSSQISVNSFSIFWRYSLMRATWASLPLDSSFCSMDVTIRHDARRAPMTFLYATDSKFRSSTDSSWSDCATIFMFSTISASHIIVNSGRPCAWRGERGRGEDKATRTFVALSLLRKLGEVDGIFVLTHGLSRLVEMFSIWKEKRASCSRSGWWFPFYVTPRPTPASKGTRSTPHHDHAMAIHPPTRPSDCRYEPDGQRRGEAGAVRRGVCKNNLAQRAGEEGRERGRRCGQTHCELEEERVKYSSKPVKAANRRSQGVQAISGDGTREESS